jgi:hypothetical protein
LAVVEQVSLATLQWVRLAQIQYLAQSRLMAGAGAGLKLAVLRMVAMAEAAVELGLAGPDHRGQ